VGLLRLAKPEARLLFLAGSADAKAVSKLKEQFPNVTVHQISDPDWPLQEALQATPDALVTTLKKILV
jgi:hypothetical protein